MRINNLNNLILVISHRRSGTHVTIDSLINNFMNVSKKFIVLEQIFPNHPDHINLFSFKKRIHPKKTTIIKTHVTKDLKSQYRDSNSLSGPEKEFTLQILNNKPKIYVIRDGRDVMVSHYHYIKRMREYNVTFQEHLVKHLIPWKNHVEKWMEQEKIFIVKYEDFSSNYLEVLSRIAQFTNLEIKQNIKHIFGNISHNKLPFWKRIPKKILTSLSIVPKITAVLPRKGIVGDWKNYFDDESKKYYKKVAGEITLRLGYEKTLDW